MDQFIAPAVRHVAFHFLCSVVRERRIDTRKMHHKHWLAKSLCDLNGLDDFGTRVFLHAQGNDHVCFLDGPAHLLIGYVSRCHGEAQAPSAAACRHEQIADPLDQVWICVEVGGDECLSVSARKTRHDRRQFRTVSLRATRRTARSDPAAIKVRHDAASSTLAGFGNIPSAAA
jgi:hypothetical protein